MLNEIIFIRTVNTLAANYLCFFNNDPLLGIKYQ